MEDNAVKLLAFITSGALLGLIILNPTVFINFVHGFTDVITKMLGVAKS